MTQILLFQFESVHTEDMWDIKGHRSPQSLLPAASLIASWATEVPEEDPDLDKWDSVAAMRQHLCCWVDTRNRSLPLYFRFFEEYCIAFVLRTSPKKTMEVHRLFLLPLSSSQIAFTALFVHVIGYDNCHHLCMEHRGMPVPPTPMEGGCTNNNWSITALTSLTVLLVQYL